MKKRLAKSGPLGLRRGAAAALPSRLSLGVNRGTRQMDKKSFELHVALLMATKNMKVADARFAAWLAGPSGLKALLPLETDLGIESVIGKGV